MTMHLLAILALTATVTLTFGYNSYMVLCPDTVRPGMTFTVQFHKLSKFPKLFFTAKIETEMKTIVSRDITIPADTLNLNLVLTMPRNLQSAAHTLEVSAQDIGGAMIFKNSTSLRYLEKGFSIFIQSDKAIYKPGQKVQFRCFGTNPDLSIIFGKMDISVFDPNNNKIAQWLEVEDSSGVFQGDLQLSDQPPLGDWKIEVYLSGASKYLAFTVAEYVLPKFEVSVIVPTFALTSDKFLSGKVEAKYTFGKGVEGNGTLTIKRKYSLTKQFSMSFKINGVYNFDIEVQTLVSLFGNLNYAELEIAAEVEEILTGNSHNGSTNIQYYETEEKLVFMDGANNFKPGLKYTCYLFLSDQDNKPLSTRNSQVNVTVTMYYNTKETEPEPLPLLAEEEVLQKMILPRTTTRSSEQTKVLGPTTLNVPRNGIVPFTFAIPIFITRLAINANFGKLQSTKWLEKFQSTSKTYIQVSVKTTKPQTGQRCAFKIGSTVRQIKVNYLILSKGLIVKVGSVFLRRKTKTLRITLRANMAPSSRCVVYWTREDGEVIADSVQFNVDGMFENKVEIDFLKPSGRITKQEKPGKNVQIWITADPGSRCNVLTVDKSVLLLKSGNDLTPQKVEEEMELYDSHAPSPCRDFAPCLLSYYPVPISGVDVTAIFQNSGLKVLTDAFLYQWQQPYVYRLMAAPKMAMMEDADVSALSTNGQTGPRVRTKFPETWIYETAQANLNGTAIIETTVPDTITSWVASAFAVNRKTGLGVAPSTATLNVFLNFFIRLELPYSVVRGEQVILQANVFNFFDSVLEVEVVLKQSASFKNILIQRDRSGNTKLVLRQVEVTRFVQVAPGGGTTINLPIVPVELGNIDIEVRAVSSIAGDAVRRQLLVEPEGIAESYNIPVLIDLTEHNSFSQSQSITLPDDVVEGSVRVRISAIGDLMGPSMAGLTSLLAMPFGCGEQNMITFVPNIFIITYLDAIDNLKPEDENKAKGFMLVGYQKELTYQHFDGAFSAFGNSDPSGSTWLTAFVVKSFAQASSYIYIDPIVMKRAVDWLLNKYTTSGTFTEPGRVIHTEMQGGSAYGTRNLATYTLIALKEADDAGFSSSSPAELTATITSALGFLESAVPDMDDTYELAIASYALALAGSSHLSTVLNKLDMKATISGGMKYWEIEEEPDLSVLRWMPPHQQARSRNIETTAYVLLAYATSHDIVNGLPILKWLVNQRNPNGGFGSTQDTVIALQALAEFGALIHSDDFNIDIRIDGSPTSFNHIFDINPNNALVLQSVDAPADTANININASGSGMALLEVAVNYNVLDDFMEPMYNLKLNFKDETLNGFKLRICFRWLGEGESGMSVLEVGLLSGFTAEKFSITNLGIMKRVEDGDKKLVIYLERVPGNETSCMDVRMQREGLVAGSQPAVVRLVDYYQPEKHAFSMYQPVLMRDSNVCSLAEGKFC